MLLGAKRIAFLGLLLACSVLLVVLGGVIEFNTLFLLTAASFCVGIAIRECGVMYGVGFYIASILLSFLLAPNKLYCLTFSCMGFYILVAEGAWEWLSTYNNRKNRKAMLWGIKYITFNLMFIPALIFMPKLFYQGTINVKFLLLFLVLGQVALFAFDQVYKYFQAFIWSKFRRHVN